MITIRAGPQDDPQDDPQDCAGYRCWSATQTRRPTAELARAVLHMRSTTVPGQVALGRAGHMVYAGMRATAGRNAGAVAGLAELSVAEAIDVRGLEMDVQDRWGAKICLACDLRR